MNSFAQSLANKTDKAPVESDKKVDAAEVVEDVAEEFVQWTSHPILSLVVGGFQFIDGLLKIKKGHEDVERFEKLVESFADDPSSPITQNVRKIDVDAADAIAQKFLEERAGRVTVGVDTTNNGVPSPTPQEHHQ